MSSNLIIAFLAGLLVLYIIAKIFMVPIKIVAKLILNALMGGFLLWVIDYFGAGIGLNIAINPITALIAGVLGVPGIVLLVALQYLLIK